MTNAPKRSKALRGATQARLHSPLLKGKTKADEVIAFANELEMPLLPWQEWVLQDMMKVDKKDQYIRKTILLLVARQNGKTHLGRMRVLWGMFRGGETKMLIMSSNRATALMTFREIAWVIESNPGLKALTKAIRYANGGERIELLNGATLDIVSDTRDSARGRTADFLWIDEIREISEEGFKAATPTTRARANSQTFLTSNAGDAFSTVLNNLRERALSYPPQSFGFYEYSAPQYCKIDDRKAWAMANPSMNYTITEEAIEESVATQPIETTRTETLTQWIDSLQSPWTHGAWEACSNSDLVMSEGAYTIFAFDKSPSSRSASLVAGQILPDGKIGLALVQTWESQHSVDELKIAADIKTWCDQYHPRMVCHDKYTTQSIADRLKNAGVICEDVSGTKFYQACSDLKEAMDMNRIVHSGQDVLTQQMNNCAAKVNDQAWRIVRRKSAGDVTAPIGLAMVVTKLILPVPKPQIYA